MAAPRSSDDDEFRVSERDDVGENSADGLAEDTTRGRRLGPRTGRRGQEPVHVDGRRPGLPQAELAEDLDERNRLALRAGVTVNQTFPPTAPGTRCSCWPSAASPTSRQEILHYSPVKAGAAYLPITAGFAVGLAAGLLNASQQVGSALGLAILSAIAITRTNDLLAAHTARLDALDAGYHPGLLVGSILLIGAAVIALRIGNTRAAAPLVLAPSAAAPEHADT